MPESELRSRAQTMADSIDAMLAFAEQQEDFLLAAKLEEVRYLIAERYLSAC